MINFTRAFDSAWERMQVILFRPFDAGKWFAIGLSAFLAGLVSGGNGFNSFRGNNFNDFKNIGHPSASVQANNANIHDMIAKILAPFSTWQMGFAVIIGMIAFVFFVGFILLLGWLGARGQFMFLDNIVRNRGAISWPWTHYSRLANSYFLLHLLLVFISLVLILPILVIAVIMCIPLYQNNRWPLPGEIGGFIGLGLLYFVFGIALAVIMFLVREFTVPIMFRRNLTARPALAETLSVVMRNPGNVTLFLLLRIAIAIGVMVVALVICCATCCIGALPYIGTVLLLPALIFVRCFTLDCLAQFGPEYDVFTIDVPTEPPADAGWTLGGASPFSPPPPL